jgi:hypothetical protein
MSGRFLFFDPTSGQWDLGAVGGSQFRNGVFSGDVNVGGTATASLVRVLATGDAGLGTTGHGFQVGPDSATHVTMDGNEIQWRAAGGAAAAQGNINAEGGDLALGNTGHAFSITLRGTVIASSVLDASAAILELPEGTFTPTIAGSTTPGAPVYTTQLGRYTKVGNRLLGTQYIVLSSKGGMAGQLRIGGLPFNVVNTLGARASGTVGFAGSVTMGAALSITALAFQNTNYFLLYKQAAASGSSLSMTDADIADTFTLYITFNLEIA